MLCRFYRGGAITEYRTMQEEHGNQMELGSRACNAEPSPVMRLSPCNPCEALLDDASNFTLVT